MPPIFMTASERAALARLARGPLSVTEIEGDMEEKFLNHRLAVKDALRFKITTKGQLEVLRQRFRGMTTRTVHVTEVDFRTRFFEKLQRRNKEASTRNNGISGEAAE